MRFRILSVLAVIVLAASLMLVIHPKKASAAIAFDKNLGSSLHGSGCTGSVSFTTSQAAASNSKIIVIVTANALSATHTVSISGGGLSWHVDKYYDTGPSGSDQDAIASADASSGLASSTTITATYNNSSDISDFCYIAGSSFTGLATGTGNDGTNTGSTSSSPSWNGGSISTTNASDLVFGFGDGSFNSGSFTNTPTCNPSTNYTSIHCDDCNSSCGSVPDTWMDEYRIVSSTSSYTTGGTFASTVNTSNYGLSVTFKAVAANSPPAAPTLSSPASTASNVSLLPQFQLKTTDANNDYLRYKILICSDSICNNIIYTADQTASQSGWSGQNQQTGTAYTGSSSLGSSTTATYTFQTPPLNGGTTYYWEGYAIDPGGSNTWSNASSIFSFTTTSIPSAVNVGGGTTINGGTTIR